MTDKSVLAWRKRGSYLPKFMRDFHDQKELFETLHETVNVEGHEYAKSVDWMTGHCYVIDIFLWFMARHGYVLRKANTGLAFDDIGETLAQERETRAEHFRKELSSYLSKSPTPTTETPRSQHHTP